jgi:hypothetical protein
VTYRAWVYSMLSADAITLGEAIDLLRLELLYRRTGS